MNNFGSSYNLIEQQSDKEIQYFFVSRGKRDIIKAIQYILVERLNGVDVFNLGFGDYDLEKGEIVDDVNTNNGDSYKVFNTVLNTIPSFFAIYKNSMLMIEGSDSRPEFVDNCRLSCLKKCIEECKNFNRRINIYRSYVDKNYGQLTHNYLFFGGLRDDKNIVIIEPYERGKEYTSVFLLKRNP